MRNIGVKFSSIQALGPAFRALISGNTKVKITVTGNSMYPLLRSGMDEVILTCSQSYKKGDVIFYKRQDGSYILHRIIGEKDNAFYLAGDGEIDTEYPIYPEQIIGVATEFVSRGKTFSHKNLLYLIYSYIWALLLPYRHKIIKSYRKISAVLGRWSRLR